MRRRSLQEILNSISSLSSRSQKTTASHHEVSQDPPGVNSRDLKSYTVQKDENGRNRFVISPHILKRFACPFCRPAVGHVKHNDCVCFQYQAIERLLNAANLPSRYQDHLPQRANIIQEILEKKEREKEIEKRSEKSIDEFVEQFRAPQKQKDYKKVLLIYGSYGCGKTFVACDLLKTLIVHHALKGLYVDYSEMLINSYLPIKQKKEYIDKLCTVDVLLIDDLGKESFLQGKTDLLDLVLNHRYNEKKATIFTTNYYPDPLYKPHPDQKDPHYGPLISEQLSHRIGQRLYSRLLEEMIWVDFSGLQDIRKEIFRKALKST